MSGITPTSILLTISEKSLRDLITEIHTSIDQPGEGIGNAASTSIYVLIGHQCGVWPSTKGYFDKTLRRYDTRWQKINLRGA